MTSKSVCRRLAIQLDAGLSYRPNGEAVYTPSGAVELQASLLRELADTLDYLTKLKQSERRP